MPASWWLIWWKCPRHLFEQQHVALVRLNFFKPDLGNSISNLFGYMVWFCIFNIFPWDVITMIQKISPPEGHQQQQEHLLHLPWTRWYPRLCWILSRSLWYKWNKRKTRTFCTLFFLSRTWNGMTSTFRALRQVVALTCANAVRLQFSCLAQASPGSVPKMSRRLTRMIRWIIFNFPTPDF